MSISPKLLREFYDLYNRTSERTIDRIIEKLKNQESHSGRSQENIVWVRGSIAEDPEMSIGERSQQVELDGFAK